MTGASLIELFGTEEPQPQRHRLRAGALAAVLEEGNLRDIRWGGVEVLRAINYLARDTSWGTYAAVLSALDVVEGTERFEVRYNASCVGPEGRFDYRMAITGAADGTLTLRAEGRAVTEFPTNRVGFVLLHPAETAGRTLEVTHGDGRRSSLRFPDLIDPAPPALDIVVMTHFPPPELRVDLHLEGDTFEMEDQRNWSDASFKTFVRPLSRPRPYVIAKGAVDVQNISLRVTGATPPGRAALSGPQRVIPGEAVGVMPQMALFVDGAGAATGDAETLGQGVTNLIFARWQAGAEDALIAATRLAERLGAGVAVEAILTARDPGSEVAALSDALSRARIAAAPVLLAPSREFRTSAPGTLPPDEVPVDTLVGALRAAGHAGPIGAGTPSYFPEFNRNPPGPLADFVCFGGSATIHAADDPSVIETLSVIPAILRTARHRTGDRPIWLGPWTLAMRHTPYGAGLAANPKRRRMPVTGDDPRHFALFAAAYGVGLAAGTDASVACLMLAAPFGPFGLVRPDDSRSALSAVQRVLAGAAGAQRVTFPSIPGVAMIGWRSDGRLQALIASLSPEPQEVDLPPTSLRLATVEGRWEAIPTKARLTLPPFRTLLADLV